MVLPLLTNTSSTAPPAVLPVMTGDPEMPNVPPLQNTPPPLTAALLPLTVMSLTVSLPLFRIPPPDAVLLPPVIVPPPVTVSIPLFVMTLPFAAALLSARSLLRVQPFRSMVSGLPSGMTSAVSETSAVQSLLSLMVLPARARSIFCCSSFQDVAV